MQISRSFLRNNRGISEIIASLFLLLIVSVAGAALYSSSLSAFSSSSSTFQQQIDQREEQARERLSIIAVWRGTANQLNLTVLNYGKIEFTIDAVYIDGAKVSAYISGRGETVAKDGIVSVKFTSSILIVVGRTYEIIAVSERGSRDVAYWQA
jgi:archaellum component FlaF (FlaF/FlaG flagellin family)